MKVPVAPDFRSLEIAFVRASGFLKFLMNLPESPAMLRFGTA
jgi:hypothetical protein